MLSVRPDELDTERFQALVRDGRQALGTGDAARASELLAAALALWRGPPLAEVSFEEFAQAEIRRLEELRLLALESRIDADLQLGATRELIGELELLLTRHPAREHFARQLMLALYRSGRQAEALEVYQRTRAHLASEVGLEPGPGLKAVQAQILEQAPAIEMSRRGGRESASGRPGAGESATIVIVAIAGSMPRRGESGRGDEEVSGLDELLGRVWPTGVPITEWAGGLLAVFAAPQEALDAALEARAAAATARWHGGAAVRLRIGVHTGQLRINGGDYWGEDVHYAARLADAAHGGQILVSCVTAALTPGASLVDLGEHRLNDFAIPRHLFSLGAGPHPLPRTGDPLRSNLPRAHGTLIGREHERAELLAALRSDETRLVTITGPGGSGKTRLALAVAEEMVDVLADGAFFVGLAQVSEPDAVAATIAGSLGIHPPAGDAPGDAIGLALSDRQLLLMLDNFEHLLGAASLITRLLADAPQLRVLVTSQAPLRVHGERVLALGPLEVPQTNDQAAVAVAPASRLLLERARAAGPGFELTADNADSLARLCQALGGWPLALELAAARLTLLSARELVARLDQGIEVIGRGPRDLPARQRGLRAALDWSHGLLDGDQSRLLRRLSTFAGPVSLERIEQICGGGADLLESLSQLVDLSLVTRAGDGRFVLHSAVRSYARERLVMAGEDQELTRRHGEVFADVVEAWGSSFLLDVGDVWSAVLREEADIGQALSWAAATDEECFARLAGGAAMPLLFAAKLSPWNELIERALARGGVSGKPRAWLWLAASLAAFQREDVELARGRLAHTVAAAEQAGDPWLACLIWTCSILFHVLAGASDGVRESYARLSERVATLPDRALGRLVDGLEPYVLGYCEGRHAEAGALWSALIADPTRTDFAGWTALYCWPDCPLLAGDYALALDGFRAALRGARERAQAPTVAYQLEGIAIALSGLGRHHEALEACGWVASVRQTAGPAVNPWYKELLSAALARSRAALGAPLASAAYARGRALTLDKAVNAALEIDQTGGRE
jgi:predicted ATPase/class 3 adenylate cyclase